MAGVEPFDDRALETLYGELEKPLYNVIFRWVWDREEAREVVEAFVRLWRMRARVDPATARPLVYRIALNLAANRRRWRRLRRLRRLVTLDAVGPAAPGNPEDALGGAQREAALRRAVEQLPERLRRVVTLCELAGMSYAEVAAVLEVPTGTVASRRNAAMRQLRLALDEGRPREKAAAR